MGINGPWITKSYLEMILERKGVPRLNTPPPLSSRSLASNQESLVFAPKPLRITPNLVNWLEDLSQPWTRSPTKSKMEPVLATWQFILSDHSVAGGTAIDPPPFRDTLQLAPMPDSYDLDRGLLLSVQAIQMIMTMRTLYQKCKLVHGDLSEYNILHYEGHLYIIDVSQSVDLDHPHALDFLREDCVHVSDFFKKHGIAVMTIRELFDFIVDPSINDDSVDSYLEKAQQKILARGDVISVEDEIADSVFVQSYIPKTLDDVKHAEEDVQRIISGKDTGDMYYQTITGLKHLAKAQPSPAKEQLQQEGDLIPVPPTAPSGHSSSHEIESEDETDEGEDSLTDSEGEGSSSENETNAAVDRKAARKENKKKVKEEKREARKTKVPKTVKKKKKKLAKAKKYR